MKIRLLAFATAADALGARTQDLEIADTATVADLKRHLGREHAALGEILSRLAVAVNGRVAADADALSEGAEVALLPPVSGGRPRRAELSRDPLDLERLATGMADPACGALVTFTGRVRGRTGEREVIGLTYDAYDAMAQPALAAIIDDLEARHPGLAMRIVHRLGDVGVGKASVVIAAASPHRAAAYEASREALERLKREVPIWKREHYADGSSVWREEEPLSLEIGSPPSPS